MDIKETMVMTDGKLTGYTGAGHIDFTVSTGDVVALAGKTVEVTWKKRSNQSIHAGNEAQVAQPGASGEGQHLAGSQMARGSFGGEGWAAARDRVGGGSDHARRLFINLWPPMIDRHDVCRGGLVVRAVRYTGSWRPAFPCDQPGTGGPFLFDRNNQALAAFGYVTRLNTAPPARARQSAPSWRSLARGFLA
jgi:hypothetical protein